MEFAGLGFDMISEEFKSAIKSSHERCKEMQIDVDQVFSRKIIEENELQRKFAEKRKMILTAAPYMEQLINIVKEYNFFALLTDGEGCILNAIGDEKILSEAFELKMFPGAYMDEASIGTNAMAMVIKTGKPIQLSGKDHYIRAYHKWTCSGAPIKDDHGRVLGVLNLTGYTEQVHPHTYGMVIAASNAIEEMIKVKELHKLQNTNNKHIKTIFNSIPMAIIASDTDGNIKIHNNEAQKLFGNSAGQLDALEMGEIIRGWEGIKDEILGGEHFEQEVSGITMTHDVNCRLNTNPMYNPLEDKIEIVYVFEKVRKINKQAFYTFDQIIGKNEEFVKIVKYAKKIADSKSTVLILGESGTGKEVFAQAIHNYSIRMDGPFIAINCGAIPKQMMELELFGYEEGAYIGAKKGGYQGKFEQADGGTILLDEIGELPIDMQIKLQRVLQEGIITRIGSDRAIRVNVRVIAASNKELRKEVELGRFRKDLFYRLNVLPLYLPPLRERADDIEQLVYTFMVNLCDSLNKEPIDIPDEQMKMMKEYSWPGNIRELENVVELIINTETIPIDYFKQSTEDDQEYDEGANYELAHVEMEHLKKVLRKNKGNISRSANDLGIRRNTLYNKIKKYGIEI